MRADDPCLRYFMAPPEKQHGRVAGQVVRGGQRRQAVGVEVEEERVGVGVGEGVVGVASFHLAPPTVRCMIPAKEVSQDHRLSRVQAQQNVARDPLLPFAMQ